MKHKILFIGLAFLCTSLSTKAFANDPLHFISNYIQTVNSETPPEAFSKYWYERARHNLHNTTEGLRKEYDLYVAIHGVLAKDGDLDTDPLVNDWGDDANTTAYTFDLNTPISNTKMPEVVSALASDDTVWTQYQITIEKENGHWVVSGETFIGSPQ